ncbi:TetR/AcrR family transcriptional regulator [bacterium]|nr:TetR/AcrR family transcriptional regulator [bacterium]
MPPRAASKDRRPAPAPARGPDSRAAILAAAEDAFARAGMEGARIDAIAATAGVNKALLYYYFGSKGGLYEAVMDDHFREFNRQAVAVLQEPGPAGAVLLRYVSLYFDFISARRRYAALYHQLMTARGRSLERLARRYLVPRNAAFKKLLERGVRAGEFRRTDPRHTAMSVVGLIVFYFSAAPVLRVLGHADAYAPASLARRKREVLDFIRHGLFLDSGASSS